jgi:hypothetical protein
MRAHHDSHWKRALDVALEILVGIALVFLIWFHVIHKNDSWMPRVVVLKGGFSLVLGLLTVWLSVHKKRLQDNEGKRREITSSGFDSWVVGLTLGIAGTIYGLSLLDGAFGGEFVPTGVGRVALVTFYALSGTVSFVWSIKFLAWSVEREEQTVDLESSEALPLKPRISTAVLGVLLACQGIGLVIAAWKIWRA